MDRIKDEAVRLFWLVDLSPLVDPAPGAAPGSYPKHRQHVIDTVVSLATAILTGTPDINILATSREPLSVAGESEYRLRPLRTPQPSSLSAAEAAAFPAVQLFVERVTAVVEDFALTDANAPLVVEICRRLDGLPLAIEFAAARVEVLGIDGLAAHLDDILPLLGDGAPLGFAAAPDHAGRHRLGLQAAERGRAVVLPGSWDLYWRLYGRGGPSSGYRRSQHARRSLLNRE